MGKAIPMSPISSLRTGVQTENQKIDNDINKELNPDDSSYIEADEDGDEYDWGLANYQTVKNM